MLYILEYLFIQDATKCLHEECSQVMDWDSRAALAELGPFILSFTVGFIRLTFLMISVFYILWALRALRRTFAMVIMNCSVNDQSGLIDSAVARRRI
jgi:hypothetical protein